MQNLMIENKQEVIGSIVQGLYYLSREAENAGLESIKGLLLVAIDDISGWVENAREDSPECLGADFVVNSGFLTVIEFMSKFADISDSQWKKELLDEVKKIQMMVLSNENKEVFAS
jgi:hypothetical protein